MENSKLTPINNGAILPTYTWSQTPQTLTLTIPLPPNCSKNQLKVFIKPTSLQISIKGIQILKDELQYPIDQNQSCWMIESSNVGGDGNGSGSGNEMRGDGMGSQRKELVVYLEKWRKGSVGSLGKWWSAVIEGDEEIDVGMIVDQPQPEPEPCTIDRFQQPQRYYQRFQPRLVDPIEQQRKRRKLQQFIDAHPQLDFSKCKFQ